MPGIVCTEYLQSRAELRGFDLAKLVHIVRHSGERYFDTETRLPVAVGRHDRQLVMIPCEVSGDIITPVTVHPLTVSRFVSGCEPGGSRMSKTRIRYFEQEDVLHPVLAEEPESRSLELSPNITVELNDRNELIGVEILNASAFLRDAVLESIQAKTLQLLEAQAT
jgi:uncharacterized protein YuzE